MRVVSVFAIALWLGIVGAGFRWLAIYESRPGQLGEIAPTWPAASRLARDHQRLTLVMFLHPHCPCSQASLQELYELRSAHPSDVRVCLVFCKPPGVPKGWEQTATWKQATALADIDVFCDENDAERRVFGAITSGEVLLYDAGGTLRYRGGITQARGKTGPSVGRDTIESLLSGEQPPRHEGPVFGCPLISG
jgi:hypothetical protein